jgi:hypothetical protein
MTFMDYTPSFPPVASPHAAAHMATRRAGINSARLSPLPAPADSYYSEQCADLNSLNPGIIETCRKPAYTFLTATGQTKAHRCSVRLS